MISLCRSCSIINRIPLVLKYSYAVILLQIKTPAQLEAAFSFFSTTGLENFELKEFEQSCGVGMRKQLIICTFW